MSKDFNKHLANDIINRYEQLEKETENLDDFAKIGVIRKKMNSMEKLYNASKKYINLEEDLKIIENLPTDEKALFQEDYEQIKKNIEETVEEINDAITSEQEAHLNTNIFLEIRAGTGGDEASLFAAELYKMYEKYAQLKGLKAEVLETSYNDLGGIKSITAFIKGEWAWKYFQFESGGHRVQRIPVTEKKGRVHTSTVTVAVLPEEEENSDYFNMDDVKIEYSTAQGAGGQHVNKTESAVIMIHRPTGIRVKIQDERSQHKNKDKAISVLKMRVVEHYKQLKQEETSEQRMSQIGTGERNEKIRTYNFPQNRLTHHTFNITLHNLPEIMSGGMEELFDMMLVAHKALNVNKVIA